MVSSQGIVWRCLSMAVYRQFYQSRLAQFPFCSMYNLYVTVSWANWRAACNAFGVGTFSHWRLQRWDSEDEIVCCSCQISSCIYLFNVSMRLMITSVGTTVWATTLCGFRVLCFKWIQGYSVNSPGWDTLFAVVYDCDAQLIYRGVYVSVVVYIIKFARELPMCRVELFQSALLYLV